MSSPLDVPAPRARPAATWLGILLALLLVALAVLAGQDALAAWGVPRVGRSWLGAVVGALGGLRAATWMVPAGIALALLGLALLVVALKPRRRTHVPVDGDADIWVHPDALAALARDAAEGVRGVSRVSVASNRSAVRVKVTADDPEAVTGPVEEAVRSRLAGAQVSVAVRASRLRTEGGQL